MEWSRKVEVSRVALRQFPIGWARGGLKVVESSLGEIAKEGAWEQHAERHRRPSLAFTIELLLHARCFDFAQHDVLFSLLTSHYFAVTLNSVRRLSWRPNLVVLGATGWVSP
jgi:hypothetical protein